MALSPCTLRILLRSPAVTKLGRRRLAPLLAGLACGAVIAVVTVVLGVHRSPGPVPPGPADSVEGPLAVGPLPPDAGVPANPVNPGGPLLLPFPPPPPPAPPAPPPPPPAPEAPVLSGPAGQVLALTNVQRRAAGCPPLRPSPQLTRAAQRHSQDMATRGYFSHSTPEGTTWQQREVAAGYPADKTGGENIAYGQETPAVVMRSWMNSPPHRENILSCEFTTMGVGYYPHGHYWTQDFGY
jgi:uncharacterized protein YkwD